MLTGLECDLHSTIKLVDVFKIMNMFTCFAQLELEEFVFIHNYFSRRMSKLIKFTSL